MFFIKILNHVFYPKDIYNSTNGRRYYKDIDLKYRNPETGEMLIPELVRSATPYFVYSVYINKRTGEELLPTELNQKIGKNMHAHILSNNTVIEVSVERNKRDELVYTTSPYISDFHILSDDDTTDRYLSVILDTLVEKYNIMELEDNEERTSLIYKIASLMIRFHNEVSSFKCLRLFSIPMEMLYSPNEEFCPIEIKPTSDEEFEEWEYKNIRLRRIESLAIKAKSKRKTTKPKK